MTSVKQDLAVAIGSVFTSGLAVFRRPSDKCGNWLARLIGANPADTPAVRREVDESIPAAELLQRRLAAGKKLKRETSETKVEGEPPSEQAAKRFLSSVQK